MLTLLRNGFIQRSRATSSLGLRKRNLSELPNLPKYKTNFPLSQMPKSVVVAVELNLR